MEYIDSNSDLLEVGDVLISKGYGSDTVEMVSFVGVEGYVLFAINVRIVGMTERYVRRAKISDRWPRVVRKRDTEEYNWFLAELKEGKYK